ncbi:hypothetical protein BDW72DRAFT_172403 [Aspergillus terricola var. indicus]
MMNMYFTSFLPRSWNFGWIFFLLFFVSCSLCCRPSPPGRGGFFPFYLSRPRL